jgi:hypothetical protein
MTALLVRGQSTIPVLSQAPRRPSTTWLACAGALAYCSWPLAFLVNPSLAGDGLASSFEAPSQPFSWLFILLDCIAGLCITIVGIRELRPHHGLLRQRRAFALVVLSYAAFGLATAADALVPLRCGSRSVQAAQARSGPSLRMISSPAPPWCPCASQRSRWLFTWQEDRRWCNLPFQLLLPSR